MENLKKLRIARNMSQLRLAMELGLSQQSIHKYETGKAEPDIRTLIELARFFHVSVDYLVGYTDMSGATYTLPGGTPSHGIEAPTRSDTKRVPRKSSARKKTQAEPSVSLCLSPADYHFYLLYKSLSPDVRKSLGVILEEMVS